MNLDNIVISLRPRSSWQSIDLGFKLGSKWFIKLVLLWCILSIPVYLICKLAGLPALATLTLWWWMKPLYEAPMYFWCSRAVFNEPVSYRQSLTQLWKNLPALLATFLTLWRLDSARSLTMNIVMVENHNRKDRSARKSVLNRVNTKSGLLILTCLHIELILTYSLLLVGYMMLPAEYISVEFTSLIEGTAGSQAATVLECCALIAMGIVAPFYVCSGFSSYINRRTHLEAWDIDLQFHRMVDRHARHLSGTRKTFSRKPDELQTVAANGTSVKADQPESTTDTATGDNSAGKNHRGPSSAVAALLLATFVSISSPDVTAHTINASSDSSDASQTLIGEVLQHKDFGSTRTVKKLKRRNEKPKKKTTDRDLSWLQEFFSKLAFLSAGLEVILWILAAAVLGFLIFHIFRNSRQIQFVTDLIGFKRQKVAQTKLFDLDIAPESLPEDIPHSAQLLLKNGQQREAMSLLYRGALSRLVHHYDMKITDSATEQQCLDQVSREQPAPRKNVFSILTRLWLQVAYGRSELREEQLTGLCAEWESAFGRTGTSL